MSANNQQQIGRIAFRHEGEDWVAYYAPDTLSMAGALELARVRMQIIASMGRTLQRQNQFMELARDLFADVCEERLGFRPKFGQSQSAPEHERSGNA
jgi:hypothetical protein